MTTDSIKDVEFARCLADSGVLVYTGPFTFLIHSAMPTIADNMALFYLSRFPFATNSATNFIDFRISVNPFSWPKSWFHKQARFLLDSQAVFNPFPLYHATAMLEWGMNWCVSTQIHTYLIVHAAVIERNGLAAVLPAPPGSGKSTLCASLVQEGWRLLSDELTLIDLDTYHAVPMPRPIGLKNQSIDIIKQRYPEAVFGVLSSDTLKGSVCHLKPPESSVALQQVTCPVGWIIFPKFEANAATELLPKSKGQAFMEIANNAFNYSTLGTTGFEVLKNVVDRANCFSFKYSQLDEAIDVFANLPVVHEI